MTEARDPAIKLFGRTIPLPESLPAALAVAAAEKEEEENWVAPRPSMEPETEPIGDDKDFCGEISSTEVKGLTCVPKELDQAEPNSSSCTTNDIEDNHQTSTQDEKAAVELKPEQDQTDADASGQEKVLKKPDKILPCPRCNSMDTKFCYYNNYNVNQPRHFCKNCQRYWTAGGTMRNVPVGAGRRKNKHSASHYRQLVMSTEGLASTRVDAPDSSHQALPCNPAPTRPLKGNGTVLKFGPEAPLCESIASILNLREQKRNAEFSPMACGENREEPSCASSVEASTCVENGLSDNPVQIEQNSMQGYSDGVTPMHNLQYYSGPPWPYPWNPSWNNIAAAAGAATRCSEVASGQENSCPTSIPWSGPPIMAAPAFCGPTIPFPFVPASFWGFMPGWTSGAWNIPWAGNNGGLSPTPSKSNSACSGNGSPTLGKHSRDASSQVEEKTEKSLWIPKTLRIDDPDEAAKSSIWATLGIKPDEGGIFKDFRSKKDGKGQATDATQALHANPAALSRFQSFQEST